MTTIESGAAPLVAPSEFIGGDARAYLATAGRGLVPNASVEATSRYFRARTGLDPDEPSLNDTDRAAKAAVGALLGADADDIALVGSTSDAIGAIYALARCRPGDNVVLVTDALEFPSVALPALGLEAAGVEIRRVDHRQWVVPPDALAASVDARTRLVFVSHVSYRTGHRFDLPGLADAVRARGDALLAVDASQSLGVVPVEASCCDFVVSTTFKWLLGAHGSAVLYWNRDRCPDAAPVSIGWHAVEDDLARPVTLKATAARFEAGSAAYLPSYPLQVSAELLHGIGIDRLAAHAGALATRLDAGLRERQRPVLTPDDPARRAGIVCWADDRCEATAAALAERGVVVSGSAGRIRAALHLYNDADDVDRLLSALDEIG